MAKMNSNTNNETTNKLTTLSNKILQMMNDDEIMKRKLMIDGDGIGDDRKITSLIKQFILWCYNDNESELESQLSAERLMNAIDQSELAMAKSVQTIKMITHELDNYENIYKNIEKAINDAKEKLQTCKTELAYAKQIRLYKLDYDSVANIIEQHPSTQETQKKLNLLENELKSLQKINYEVENKLEKRRKQFQLLLSTSHQLQSVLDDDNNNISNNINLIEIPLFNSNIEKPIQPSQPPPPQPPTISEQQQQQSSTDTPISMEIN